MLYIGVFQQIVNGINETIVLCYNLHPKIKYKHLVRVDLNSLDKLTITQLKNIYYFYVVTKHAIRLLEIQK